MPDDLVHEPGLADAALARDEDIGSVRIDESTAPSRSASSSSPPTRRGLVGRRA